MIRPVEVVDELVNSKRVEEVEESIGTIEAQLLTSIAISLKRIADAITSGSLPEGLHQQITHLAWEAGQNFGRGAEQGRRS